MSVSLSGSMVKKRIETDRSPDTVVEWPIFRIDQEVLLKHFAAEAGWANGLGSVVPHCCFVAKFNTIIISLGKR